MSTVIGTERVGQRIYVVGDSYAIRDRLKRIGCHWDGDRRQWWIGAAKGAEIEALIGRAATEAPPKEDLDAARVKAKVEYKGRTYYAIAETRDGAKMRLVTMDGSVDFWAATGECKTLKTYAPRTRTWRGRTETSYTTLGSIRRFVAEIKEAKATGAPTCAECGRPGELIEDLEDGMLKHRGCCDIPSC